MNKMMKWSLSVACAVISTGSVMAQGDGGPLIDALVKKGVLSSQEGEEIRADMTADLASTPGGMISWGSSAVKGVKIYGDARLRYQWENATSATSTTDRNQDRSRYRYRLRIGGDYQFSENWSGGVRLETAKASDSTNGDLGGYFSKVGDEVYVGLVYLQYTTNNPEIFGFSPADSFDLRMGKHAHPFLLSQAFWDSDINPEGFSEQVGWTNVFTDGLDVTLRGGQYIISEERNSQINTEDGFLFVAQSEFKYTWAPKTSFAIAPMMIKESAGTFLRSEPGAAGTNTVDNENSITTLGNMTAVLLPMEANWTMFGFPQKAYGTVGTNIDADSFAAENGATNQDSLFWNVGYTFGSAKNKGSWEIGVEYRYLGAAAYTPNLSDSDFGKNILNQQGVVVSSKYAFTDNISGGVTWMHSNQIEGDNTNGSTNNSAVGAEADTVDLVQVDLMWKF